MNTNPHQERRKLDRHEVSGQIKAIDKASGQTLGQLVDIHSEGLMLLTGPQVDVGNIYQLVLQKGNTGETWLEIGVDCLWKNSASGEDRFWTGFRVIDASEEALSTLEQLGLER